MSDSKQKKSKNIIIHPEATEETEPSVVSESESEPEVIELTRTDRKAPPPAPAPNKSVVEKKKESLAKARAVLQERRAKQREEDEKAKRLIEKSYEKELEASLVKTTLPKYSRQIKKAILEKLKQRKLEELKKTYGYESSESESEESESESSESEEEEVVIVKKKKKVPVPVPKKEVKQHSVKVAKQVEAQKPVGLLEKMRQFGF